MTFQWALSTPAESASALDNPQSATPTFVADVPGTYQATLSVSDPIGPGLSDSVDITATTAESFAEIEIEAANTILVSLPAEDLTTDGNQRALTNFFMQAIVAIQEGSLADAIDKLNKAIARTDGCVLRGAPDGNGPGRDWVTGCAEQGTLYSALVAARDALLPE